MRRRRTRYMLLVFTDARHCLFRIRPGKRASLSVAEAAPLIGHSQQTRLPKQILKVTSNETISQIVRTPIVAETRLLPIA